MLALPLALPKPPLAHFACMPTTASSTSSSTAPLSRPPYLRPSPPLTPLPSPRSCWKITTLSLSQPRDPTTLTHSFSVILFAAPSLRPCAAVPMASLSTLNIFSPTPPPAFSALQLTPRTLPSAALATEMQPNQLLPLLMLRVSSTCFPALLSCALLMAPLSLTLAPLVPVPTSPLTHSQAISVLT